MTKHVHSESASGKPDLSFDWDDRNISHLAPHRIKPSDVEDVFHRHPIIRDHEVVDGEDRWTAAGATNALRVLVMVFTLRAENIRPITGWAADRRTKKEYFTERYIVHRKKLVIPSFQSESAEAAWWEKHRAAVEADLRAAMRERRTISIEEMVAQSRRKKELLPVTIRLASEDIAVARQLAEDKGIGYQTYIKLLLHNALLKEAARQGRAGK